jgi:hypothetical protein
MPCKPIDACTNGCVLFRKDHKDAKYCPKCKSSRYLEVDSGDGHKRQLDIPVKIVWYLPFIPRIQRLYMPEQTAKQMTWHKKAYDTIPRSTWYIQPMLRLGNILTAVIVKRLRKLEMYVLRWLHMSSILME